MELLIDILDVLLLYTLFALVFVLPPYPLVRMMFPGRRTEQILLAAAHGMVGGVLAGIVLIPLGVFSAYSILAFMAAYYAASYGGYYRISGKKPSLAEVREAFDSILDMARAPTGDIWAAAAVMAFFMGAILRFRSALLTGTMGDGDAWGHFYMASNLLYDRVFFAPDFYGAYPRGTHIIYSELSLITGIRLLDTIRLGGPMFGSLTFLPMYVIAGRFLDRRSASLAAVLYVIPVLGLLPPPFPVWFGYLFPRQTVAVTESIGLVYMAAQLILAHDILRFRETKTVAFFTVISIGFSYIHPISVLYTAILLVILGLLYADTLLRSMSIAMEYAAMVVLAPAVVYVYYSTVKAFYDVTPSAVQGSPDIVEEAAGSFLGIPYYNINPYYTAMFLLAALVLAYAIRERSRGVSFVALSVVALGILSCLGIGLFTSPARPVYNLNFYTPMFYGLIVSSVIRPEKLIAATSALHPWLGRRLEWLSRYHPPVMLYPAALLALMTAYSVLFYMNFSAYSPFRGTMDIASIALVSLLAAPTVVAMFSHGGRPYALLLLELSAAVVFYLLYGAGHHLLALAVAVAMLFTAAAMHARLSGVDKRVVVILETAMVGAVLIYLMPSASVVRKTYPLLALIPLSFALYERKAHRTYWILASVAILMYAAFRLTTSLQTMTTWVIAAVTAVSFAFAMLGEGLEWRERALIALVGVVVPLGFSMYYTYLFAIAAPVAVLLLAATTSEGKGGLSPAVKRYSVAASVFLLAELTLIYPPVMDFMKGIGAGHLAVKLSWAIPELTVIAYIGAEFLHTRSPPEWHRIPKARARPAQGRAVGVPTAIVIAMVFLLIAPPFVPLREVPPFHYTEWRENIDTLNGDFPPNQTAVYARIEPGFLMKSAFARGMEVHSLDELLDVPPMYYVPSREYTLVCLDRYNYSRYASLPSRYFHSDYWRTSDVYLWLNEYESYHGNGTVSLYMEGKYTRVYLIRGGGGDGT